jgi:acetyl esterase
MPVSPALEPFLVAAADAPGAPTDPQERVETMRNAVATFFTLGAGEPEPMHAVDDLECDGSHGPIPVRRYLPTADAGLPVVMFFHGGGFVCGNVACYDAIVRRLAAEARAAVFSVDYRLAPEHPFPAPLDDCFAALRWVVSEAETLGVDASRVAVAGDSAGGNLSAAIALQARAEGQPLRAQALIYPVIDPGCDSPSMTDNGEGYLLTAASMREMWDWYLSGGADRSHSFVAVGKAADMSGLPPAIVVTAEFDPLRDEGERYAAQLDGSGVETKLIRYDGMIHGFIGMREIVPEANAAMGEVASFLRAHLA